jgi:hypothetical protein
MIQIVGDVCECIALVVLLVAFIIHLVMIQRAMRSIRDLNYLKLEYYRALESLAAISVRGREHENS